MRKGWLQQDIQQQLARPLGINSFACIPLATGLRRCELMLLFWSIWRIVFAAADLCPCWFVFILLHSMWSDNAVVDSVCLHSHTHSCPPIPPLLTVLLNLPLLPLRLPLRSVLHGQNSTLIPQHVFTRPSISYMNFPNWIAIEETKILQGHRETERVLALRINVSLLYVSSLC